MIEVLKKHIKTNVAQITQLFNISTQNITPTLQSNIISNMGLADGEWTLSGGVDRTQSSKGCVNRTFNVVANKATTDCFFGDTASVVNLVAQKVNVGSAITRELAYEMIKDVKTGNCIIVYMDSARNVTQESKNVLSDYLCANISYSIGVIFKIEASQMETLGCSNTDKGFIRSVLGMREASSNMIRFESINSRFYVGNDYCVDYSFSYEDVLELDDIIKSRLRHFDVVFEDLKLNM